MKKNKATLFLNWCKTRSFFTDQNIVDYCSRNYFLPDSAISKFIKSGELFKLSKSELKIMNIETKHKFYMSKLTYEKFFKRKDK